MRLIRRHRGRRRGGRGSSVLYAVLLSPVILLSLALAAQLGALQLDRERLHGVADQAAVAAAGEAAVGGVLVQLDPASAVWSARRALVDNLQPLRSMLAGVTPEQLADSATVTPVRSLDASGTAVVRAVTVEVRAPVSSGLLRAAGLPGIIEITVRATAEVRQQGGTGSQT